MTQQTQTHLPSCPHTQVAFKLLVAAVADPSERVRLAVLGALEGSRALDDFLAQVGCLVDTQGHMAGAQGQRGGRMRPLLMLVDAGSGEQDPSKLPPSSVALACRAPSHKQSARARLPALLPALPLCGPEPHTVCHIHLPTYLPTYMRSDSHPLPPPTPLPFRPTACAPSLWP